MKRILVALSVLLSLVSVAHAQKTKAQMTTEINSNLPDNTTGAITPAIVRTTLLDLVASYVDLNGSSSFSCASHQWASSGTTAGFTCSQPVFSDVSGQASLSQLPNLTAGQIYQVPANGSTGAPSAAIARTLLTATTVFYVNADGAATHPCGAFTCSAGSDSNNCASNTTPCQTIQNAVAVMANNYDFGGQTVSLQLADGTYTECVNLPPYVSSNANDKNVFILGHSGSASSVTVNCTTASSNAFTAVNVGPGWYIQNMTLKATNACVNADYHSAIYISGVAFDACINTDVRSTGPGSMVEFFGNYSTSTNKGAHAIALNGGLVLWSTVTVTVSGTPTFSNAFYVNNNGTSALGLIDNTNLTVSGSFSGPAYNLAGRSVYFSTGTSTTTAGTTQYIGLSSLSNSENNFYTFANNTPGIVDLYVNATPAPGAGKTFTVTFRLGGGGTSLTCTVSDTATGCSDLVHSTTAIAGNNVVDLQVVSSAGAAASVISGSAILR